MSKVAAYLRVSTDEQRDAGTIATQRNAISAYCKYKKLSVSAYFEDEAVSGALPMWERGQGNPLWKAIANRELDTLLIYKIDRLGRRIKYVLDFVDHCTVNGVTILAIEDSLDLSSPTGRLTLNILSAFAENERDVFRQRSLDGKRNKAESGKVISHAPYGYLLTEDYHLELDPLRAPVIKKIFERYVAGDSSHQIVKMLNETKAPLPLRGKGKWRFDNLLLYLKNPAYYGEYHHNRTPKIWDGKRTATKRDSSEIIVMPCPAIISKSLWEQAQKMRELNTNLGPKSGKRFYLLRGLITCGKCGLNYVGHTVVPRPRQNKKGELISYAEHSYYHCASKTSRDYEYCGNVSVRQDDLESIIWADIESFIRNPESVIDRLLEQQREMSKSANDIQANIFKLDKRIEKNQKQKTNIVLAIGSGKISNDDAASAIEQLNGEIDTLNIQIKELETRLKNENADGGRRIINDTNDLILALNSKIDAGLNDEEKTSILRSLVKEIIVDTKEEENKKYPDVTVTYLFERKNYLSDVDSPFRLSSRKK